MSLTTSTITGRIPLPNNSVSGSVSVVFTLNSTDTQGVNTIPQDSSVRYRMMETGEFPAGAVLWRNTSGLRGTSYRVEVQWIEVESGRPVTKDVMLGYVQVGDAPSYSLSDLLAAPSAGAIGWYVNVPQALWDDFNDRLDYMYSIAESSLPATVERAVEAELAAAQSAIDADLSAQAAAGSAVQAVEDVEDARVAALTAVSTARSDALSDVGTARSDALTAIGTAEGASVTAVETARDDALDLINPKVQQAETAAQTATTKAGEANTSAGAAATSAGNAATSETNAGVSAGAAATSASNAYGSEISAASSADAAAGALASVVAASDAAAISEANALASEVAAQASETAAAGSAGSAAASAGAASSSAGAALNSASAAALSAGSANDAWVATQDLMDEFANFRFLGKVEWWAGNPSMIPAGFLPLNGQVLNRADYPDLWEDISNGVFVSVTDSVWQSDAVARGRFSLGNGTTTFRMPDLNGAQSGSKNGAFLRGTKNPETYGPGAILGDAIRNITGTFGRPTHHGTGTIYEANGGSGAFAGQELTTSYRELNSILVNNGTPVYPKLFNFDASRQVPTSSENRPVSAVGTWIMLVNGAPARQFNPETGAGLGSNTFGGLQKFNAGFEFTGVVPQLIQTDVDQGLTVAQKLMAATNTGAVSYASPQTLTALEKRRALENIAALSYGEDQSGAITAAQKLMSRKNIGMGTPAEIAVITQALSVGNWGSGGHHYDFRSMQGDGTQIWRFLQSTHVKQPSSGDSTTIAYSWTFIGNAPQPVVSNGDANVEGALLMSVFDTSTSSFKVACRLNGAQYLGVYRVNYAAMGRLS